MTHTAMQTTINALELTHNAMETIHNATGTSQDAIINGSGRSKNVQARYGSYSEHSGTDP